MANEKPTKILGASLLPEYEALMDPSGVVEK